MATPLLNEGTGYKNYLLKLYKKLNMRERLFKAIAIDGLEVITGNSIYKTIYVSESLVSELYKIDEIEVIGETVCDCTGVEDKNGILIFENDIVLNHNGKKSDVIFEDGAFFYTDRRIRLHKNAALHVEVVGNKFDKHLSR